ncbi:MAG: F0F1 ATP synthase subunit epsilon [Campylobacteraceae bacterium]|jgi:F-type H+-transporting ATPase subunit epsilon|nr:F0F1 ATP synthase subunit epsilon [Campylobacteraceae bacterium]
MNTTKLEIVTPEGLIFSGNAKSVTFPGSEGEFGVLPNHAALLTSLKVGVIDIELESGKKEAIAINWGFVKVEETKITVLADGAVAISGDSESEIAASLEKAKKLIQSMSDSNVALAMAKVDSVSKKAY